MKNSKGSAATKAGVPRGDGYVVPRKEETPQGEQPQGEALAAKQQELPPGLDARERLWLGGVLLGWLLVFTAGVVVDTSPFRAKLTDGSWTSFFDAVGAWAVVLLAYTVSNIAILCMLSSVLGVMGSHARLGFESHHNTAESNPYYSGLIRGFVVFLVILAGLLVIDGTPFSSPSQDQYLRLAGFVSLFSFLVSYNPHAFATVMQRVQLTVQADTNGKAAERPSEPAAQPDPNRQA